MTKEQALQILKDVSVNIKSHPTEKVKEALKLASTIQMPS
jgi:hypothetical protein